MREPFIEFEISCDRLKGIFCKTNMGTHYRRCPYEKIHLLKVKNGTGGGNRRNLKQKPTERWFVAFIPLTFFSRNP
jgi:hypothetical protein